MPPKTVSVNNQELADKLEEITKILASHTAKFENLEGLLAAAKKENSELKKNLGDRDCEISRLNEKLNTLEQYGRSWSIRIMNLPIPSEVAEDNFAVMQIVYEKALLPILQGAVETGALHKIPHYDEILETAHVLPAKAGSTPPIICRFYSRNVKSMIFRLKREFAPRQTQDRATRASNPPPSKFLFPLYEDLTRANFHKMRALAAHELVHSSWSVSGNLRYKLKSSDKVFRVKNNLDPIEKILADKQ